MIKVETTTETIESKGGLILAGKIAKKAGLGAIKSLIVKNAGIIIAGMFGLLVEGKSDFESMGEKRGNLFFKEALGLPYVYAKETVRLYLGKMAEDADGIVEQLRESSAKIISQAPLHGLWIQGRHYLPVDIDTTAMDNSKTKKEGVGRTYQGFDGFHCLIRSNWYSDPALSDQRIRKHPAKGSGFIRAKPGASLLNIKAGSCFVKKNFSQALFQHQIS